ncbi:MAG TPA: hypothetical protein VHY91_07925 [Pirellulales bacterium]|jgi:hypothetical protein|nr:hypothetical protein [Pirellulales bacterium]
MELQEALLQIGEIRDKLARTEIVAPTRSLTVGGVGVLACAGGLVQSIAIPQPSADVHAYLSLWIGVATLSAAIVAAELIVRCLRTESAIRRQATRQAVEQFVPCLLAGGCLTLAIAKYAPAGAALLPGLWAIMFGLGMFAAWRQLPAATVLVAAWYLISGTVALATAQGDAAFSPWAMLGTFGCGHFLLAATFYFSLERRHGTN